MIAGMFNIKSADGGMLLSGTLGFYLLLCTYSAIVFYVLSYYLPGGGGGEHFRHDRYISYIGQLWQGIDFVRDLTYFLSFLVVRAYAERTDHDQGCALFVIIVYIFLGLTIYKLKSGRNPNRSLSGGRYVAIVVSALVAGYISSRPALTGYWMLRQQIRTLTPNAQRIIRELGTSHSM